jgi:formate hydrogenlyase subunit 6/NADH:ubiquinone oxidoreductase subunit I
LKFERYGIGIAKGLAVTVRHLLRYPVTTRFPEQRLNISRRTRGNELIWDKDKCTGCGTCAKACHIGAIHITTSTRLVDNKYEVQKYEVDTGYCIFCGLCVEACPFGALFMSYDCERAQYRRQELVQSKEKMMETPERKVSGYFYPERAAKLPRQSLLVDNDRGQR